MTLLSYQRQTTHKPQLQLQQHTPAIFYLCVGLWKVTMAKFTGMNSQRSRRNKLRVWLTRGSAVAERSRDPSCHWIFLLSHLRSLKVIGNGTMRKLGYGFLFAFRSNYGSILYHYPDKARYWFKITIISYPLAFDTPVRGVAVGVLPYRLLCSN